MRSFTLSSLTICMLISTQALQLNAAYLGPSPYTSFNNPASNSSISPFASVTNFTYFHLEDFEDRQLNVPGVTLREFSSLNLATATSDSVDGDDGQIDGIATNTSSLISNFTASSFTFDFNINVLGVYPTHAGIVWTDIGRNFGGAPFPADLIDNVLFEAFNSSGASLGVHGPFSLGDGDIFRTTAEDRFLGIQDNNGISAIRISMPNKNNWEVDHLQYGSVNAIPKPSTYAALVGIGLPVLWLHSRRRKQQRAENNTLAV